MSLPRVAILISGAGSNMAALIAAMRDGRVAAEPALVISNEPRAGGLALARQMGVPALAEDHRAHRDRAGFEAALSAHLAGIDVICLAGFMRVLTAGFTAAWAGRILNIHPSILPLFPGLHTHRRALEAGMAVHGATVHLVTEALDAGPILGQAVIPVRADDTPETLAARLLPMEHRLYPAVLARHLAGDRRPVALFAAEEP